VSLYAVALTSFFFRLLGFLRRKADEQSSRIGPTFSVAHVHDDPKISKLFYFVYIFAKYWPIFTIFSPVDSVKTLLLSGMHTTPIVSLHYLVKHKYPKINNI